MRHQVTTLAIAIGLCVLSGPVLADHNSKNGEGWANMPNDIHNTRVETLENDDNEAFREFVKNGEGSRTVNRFESDDTQPNDTSSSKGEPRTAVRQSESTRNAQVETSNRTSTRSQTRSASRSRMDSATSRMSRTSFGRTSMRMGGGRRGGGKR